MKIQITHPIVTEDSILQPGDIVDADANKAAKWIEKEWACAVVDDDKKDDDEKPVGRGKK